MNQQVLFSVYVHPPPDYEGYSEDSLFYMTEIADRVNSSWGTFDLAQVALYVTSWPFSKSCMHCGVELDLSLSSSKC